MSLQSSELSPLALKLAPSGRLDPVGVGTMELAFTALASGTDKHVLVDFSDVPFCGSLGVRMLIAAARVVQRRGRKLVIYGVRPAVAEVFETMALGQLMPIVATEKEALAQAEA